MHPWDIDPEHPGLTLPEVEAYQAAATELVTARRKAAQQTATKRRTRRR